MECHRGENSDNDVRFGRDGVFIVTSRKNVISGNSLRDLRFAVHYMYANDGEITNNLSAGNHVGYALMYSQGLSVRGNFSDRDRDHGLLFNYANGSEISGNVVEGGFLPSTRWTSSVDLDEATMTQTSESGALTAPAETTVSPPRNACSFTTQTTTASAIIGSRLRDRHPLHGRVGRE